MIKTILFLILLVVIIIIGAILIKINLPASNAKKTSFDYTKKPNKKTNNILKTILVASIGLIAFIPGSFHQVEAGQVAVVKRLGKVVGTRNPGTYFDFYMTNEYIYFDTTVQKLDIKTVSYSSDAQTMDISMTVQYRIDPTKADKILTEYTSMESLESRIEKVSDDHIKAILSKYTAMKIIETRASISPQVEESIKIAIGDRYYASVTAVNLTNIDFTKEFEKSVEDKVIAEQQKEAAITKAEQELEVAKLNAQAKIEAAQGDAESRKIISEAEAQAMAVKIVELAKSQGFTVNETYIKKVNTLIQDFDSKETISNLTVEEEVIEKPTEGVIVTKNDEDHTLNTITTTIKSTKYSIEYDETHTKEDLKIIIDFIEYLEYLEKWDGVLPTVVSGDKAVDIMVPVTNN